MFCYCLAGAQQDEWWGECWCLRPRTLSVLAQHCFYFFISLSILFLERFFFLNAGLCIHCNAIDRHATDRHPASLVHSAKSPHTDALHPRSILWVFCTAGFKKGVDKIELNEANTNAPLVLLTRTETKHEVLSLFPLHRLAHHHNSTDNDCVGNPKHTTFINPPPACGQHRGKLAAYTEPTDTPGGCSTTGMCLWCRLWILYNP